MTLWSMLALCSFVVPAFSQSNGIDSSMDMPMDLAMGQMLPYVHFTPGDTLWFLGWVPNSARSMVGACFGVFFLGVLERWLSVCLAFGERHWVERESILALEKSDDAKSLASPPPLSIKKFKWLRFPLFVPEFDITRGVLFAAHAFIRILLMLVAMTFQLAFILSIAIGSGVGETLFGRFLSLSDTH